MWTDEGERLIIELWDKGFSGYQIAVALKTTRSAILGKISRMRRKGMTFNRQYNPGRAKKGSRKAPTPVNLPPVTVTVQSLKMKKPEPDPKPIVVIIPEPPPYTGKPLTILEVTNDTCKYSVSGTRAPHYRFCGGPTFKRSLCKHHFELCYTSLKKPEQKRA
jgi:hypothetical protein